MSAHFENKVRTRGGAGGVIISPAQASEVGNAQCSVFEGKGQFLAGGENRDRLWFFGKRDACDGVHVLREEMDEKRIGVFRTNNGVSGSPVAALRGINRLPVGTQPLPHFFQS